MTSTKEALSLIFEPKDKIFICNVDEYGTRHEFVGSLPAVEIELARKPRNFFCINSVRGQRRLKSELAQYRNFLFESDTTPLEQQFILLPTIMDLGIVRTATYSGGKSIHYMISAADDLQLGEVGSESAETAYKQIWLGLANILANTGLIIDQAGKNPATLSRLPGAIRGETEQRLLATGPLVTSEFLKSVAVSPNKNVYVRSSGTVTSMLELEQKLAEPQHGRLAMQIKYPAWVSEHAGNYPNIYKITLWAIDEVGATPETLFPYFEKHLEPKLIAKNYHKDWRLAVQHAFRMKGF